MIPSKEEALALLMKYNKGEFHIKHGKVVGDCLRIFAEKLGYGEEAGFWEAVGILHDIDFELYPNEHCVKAQEIMASEGLDERLIRAAASHGYGIVVDIQPEHEMEKVLYAVDELTGLIGAAALMLPSKSLDDLKVSSLKKKFKDKRFAAGCSRDVISKGAEMLGWDLDRLMEETLEAMRLSPAAR